MLNTVQLIFEDSEGIVTNIELLGIILGELQEGGLGVTIHKLLAMIVEEFLSDEGLFDRPHPYGFDHVATTD